MSYQRIRLEEREEIFRLRYLEHLTMKQIGEKLGRDKSSISRELKRGTKNRIYSPLAGEAHKRNMRKLQCPKLKVTDEIREPAKPKLEKRRPPPEIAGRLEREYNYKMSAGTIYNYIRFHMKGELKKLALSGLRLKGKKRRKGGEKAEKRGKITEMTLIDGRPAEVEGREIAGRWEGDLIIGKGHKSAILVTVERKSRFVQMDLLPEYGAGTVRKAVERRFKRLEPGLVKSIT
ncbi:MAG: hypothetical protein Pg6C_05040 [Treponemataceae bacterium]|nr:MAG: hypothetical protein Pg6C_05040 [Treponemataceae bacterium]